MSKPFGKSLLIDLYGCDPTKMDCLETAYRFSEELIRRLKMHIFLGPLAVHGPRDENGIEVYEDKEGISCVTMLIESSLVIHTIKPRNFVTIDVFTCGDLDTKDVYDLIMETYKPKRVHEHPVIIRGADYQNARNPLDKTRRL